MSTTTITRPEKLVGKRIRRREDPRMLTGTATYVDDIKLPNMLYAAFVRSPHAAANIRSIDTSKAAALPGVHGVFTGQDLKDVGSVVCGVDLPGLRKPVHTVLATDRVYLVGHAVAVVVATDRYVAADAAELVEVDYDVLPGVADPERALAPGAPAVHPEWTDNVSFRFEQKGGDIEAAFAEADVICKQRMISQRMVANPMETRGCVASWHSADRALTFYTSTQIPHLARTILAGMLGLDENRLRLIAPEVGGGFGCKLNVYPEEAVVAWLSMKLDRPVKWIETRRENFLTTIQGRGHVDYWEIAAKRDGTILGVKVKILQDLGAYHQLLTPAIPTLSVLMMPGLYNTRNIHAEIVGVFTNCVPTDAVRGAGRPEATYGIERMVDVLAAELKMDPAEIRFKNFVAPDQFPFATATGLNYDSGDYATTFHKALDMIGYKKLREEQAEARKAGRYVGIGISTYGEICAMGPSPAVASGGWESATVKVEPSGKVTVLTGISPHGQGEETTFAQVVGDELGVPIDDVLVLHGDTSIVQYGIGTFGSRGTAVGGTALYLALQDIKEKAVRWGQLLLDSTNVHFDAGYCIDNATGKSVTLQAIAAAAYRAVKIPAHSEPGLVATRFWEPSNFTYPFGAHIIHSEVDGQTGEVEIKRYVLVDDIGNILNPMIVDGQLHGGASWGIGQALWEHAIYDENAQLLTGEFMDYALARARTMPTLESAHTCTPSPVNPLGVKGVGEAGTIGSTPAMVNSVVDALATLGVTHIDMPLTPEKLWHLISERK